MREEQGGHVVVHEPGVHRELQVRHHLGGPPDGEQHLARGGGQRRSQQRPVAQEDEALGRKLGHHAKRDDALQVEVAAKPAGDDDLLDVFEVDVEALGENGDSRVDGGLRSHEVVDVGFGQHDVVAGRGLGRWDQHVLMTAVAFADVVGFGRDEPAHPVDGATQEQL